MKRYFFLFTCFMCVFTFSCDGLFYYPTQIKYNTIEREHRDVFIESRSKNRLHGLYFPARSEHKALVLFFHGNYRNVTGLYKTFVWLTDYGYDYLIVDYSGYGKSDGRAGRKSLYKDGISMLEYSAQLAYQKGYPLIVIGQSIGGATLLGSLKGFENRDSISLILIDCSFLSYKDIADYHTKNTTKLPIPLGSWIITDNHVPHESLDEIQNIPVLVSHCRQDKTVPLQFGKELYEKLQGEKWYWEFDCTHSKAYWKDENKKKLAEFFDEYLENQNSIDTPEDT